MSNSLTFASVNLSTYGLTVLTRDIPMRFDVDSVQIKDRSFADESKVPPKIISLMVAVSAADWATLESYLDSIKVTLNSKQDETLILDSLSDRYWLARLQAMTGLLEAPNLFKGQLDFICVDPYAYDTSLVSSDHSINADPKTITETPGGTAQILPVYTLTAGENLSSITLIIKNNTTDEEFTWEGSINNGEELEIDVEHWVVKLEGVADMADVSGRFPILLPSESNSLTITNFGSLGSLNIEYRNRYI